jgi:hypothetical protein
VIPECSLAAYLALLTDAMLMRGFGSSARQAPGWMCRLGGGDERTESNGGEQIEADSGLLEVAL